MDILLSVIIPVFNGEKYIAQCLDSVLSQENKSFEIIVVNDGSTDNTDSIIDRYIDRFSSVRKHTLNNNQGVSNARNVGIDMAKGEYLAFLDSDDCWLPNFFTSKLHERIIESSADSYVFSYQIKNSFGRIKSRHVEEKTVFQNDTVSPTKMSVLTLNSNCSIIYRREMINRNNIRFFPTRRHEDETFRRMGLYCSRKTVFISTPIFCYKSNQNSVTHSKISITEIYSEVLKADDMLCRWYKNHFAYDNEASDSALAMLAWSMSEYVTLLFQREFKVSFKKGMAVISKNPHYKLIKDPYLIKHLPGMWLFNKHPKVFFLKCRLQGIAFFIVTYVKNALHVLF